MPYEHRSHHPIPRAQFLHRMAFHGALAVGMILVSIALGMAGYEHYENLPWRDAFLNTAMLLGGMGPVNPPLTPGGKIFAGLYALYAGLVFLIVAGVLLVPVLHRVLHRFHWETKERS